MPTMTLEPRAATRIAEPAGPGRERVPPPLEPMPLRSAVSFFSGPALLYVFAIWGLRPLLEGAGLSPAAASGWAVGSMAAVLLLVALAAFRIEGHPLTWAAFRARYRLHAIGPTGWLWTLGAILVTFVSWLAVTMLRDALLAGFGLAVPDVPFTSNVLGLSAMLVFVTLGEDLWWRGYVLPRQELAHGRWAWFVHGTGWTLFHLATWWDLPTLWLGALAISFVSQRLRNTTPAMVVHFVVDVATVLSVAAALVT